VEVLAETTVARLFTLPLNICAVGVAACASYALMGLRREAPGRPLGDGDDVPRRRHARWDGRLVDPARSLASVASSKRAVSCGPRAYDRVMTTGIEEVTESVA